MTRVLLVGNDADYFLSHRLPLALRLCDLGYDTHIAIPCRSDDPRLSGRPFHVHPIALRRGSSQPLQELRTLFDLLSLFRQLRPDIAHHVTVKPTLYGGLAARMLGVPIVVHAMTGLGYVFTSTDRKAAFIRALASVPLRFVCRRPNVTMIFQNPTDLDIFAVRRLSHRHRSVLIRGSGVDTNVFSPTKTESTGDPVVMVVSRMLWDKGVAEFVAAARKLRGEGIKARFVLVGGTDPNPSSVPESVLQQWVMEGVVEWWGQRRDMPDVWRQAQIACLPSYAEGLPKCLLEAAATGLPMVATDIPGCREIVRENITGHLVPKCSADALAVAIRRLLEDADARIRFGTAARIVVEREFTVQNVVGQTVALYESLLAEQNDAARTAVENRAREAS